VVIRAASRATRATLEPARPGCARRGRSPAAAAGFDDSGWADATGWTANAVSPKGGYDEISWDDNAELIWGSDLKVDNTILVPLAVTQTP
jgi:hypothetical protein